METVYLMSEMKCNFFAEPFLYDGSIAKKIFLF